MSQKIEHGLSPWELEHGRVSSDQINLVGKVSGPEHEAMVEAARREGPVKFYSYDGDEGYEGFYLVTSNEVAHDVLKQSDVYSSHGPEDGGGGIAIHDLPPDNLSRSLLSMQDNPSHSKQRDLLERHFRRTKVAQIGEFLHATTRTLISQAVNAGEVDFVTAIASPIPMAGIAKILDVPTEVYDELCEQGNKITLEDSPNPGTKNEEREAARSILEISKQVREEVLAGRIDNGIVSDLSSAIYRRSQGEEPTDTQFLTSGQVDYFFILLTQAGNETTRNSLAHGAYALAKNPHQWQLLKENPELIGDAADEIVRWSSPLRYARRTTMTDVELAGVNVMQGEKVVTSILGANRDPDVFERRFDFDVERGDTLTRALSFGHGTHFCLGRHLAKLEIEVVLQELVSQVDNIELTGEIEHQPGTMMNSVASLHVEFVAA